MMSSSGSGPCNSPNPYRCTACKYVTSSYNQIHLTTWLHQKQLYDMPGQGEAELELPHVRERVIVVSRVPDAVPLIDVAKHFSKSGPIVNLVFGGKELHLEDVYGALGPTKQIFVVFEEISAVWRAVMEENTWLFGAQIGIRPLVGQLQLGLEAARTLTPVRQEYKDVHVRNGRRSSSYDQGAGMDNNMDFTADDYDPNGFRFPWESSSRNVSPLVHEAVWNNYGTTTRGLAIPRMNSCQQEVQVQRSESMSSSYDQGGKMDFTASRDPGEFRFSWERSPGNDSPVEDETANHGKGTRGSIPPSAAGQPVDEDSSWEMNTDDEENPKDDSDKSSFEQIRKGKIAVNQSLRNYFEIGIGKIQGAEDILFMDVRKKFQSLWLQYIIEFNSKFWTLCFGFEMDSLYAEPDFSKTDSEAPLTLKQRFDSIPVDNASSNLEYQCSTANNVISDLIYKKKVWKKKFMLSHIRALWAVVTNNVVTKCKDGIDLSSVQKRVKLAPSKKMEFNVRLDVTFDLREEEDVPSNENIAAFVNLSLRDVSYNEKGRSLRNKKLRFLISVYEKLAMKYCNLRIKQWIGSCEDVEFSSFDESYKKGKKRKKRRLQGHPRWRRFKRKWSLILKEREEIEERYKKMEKLEREAMKAKRLRDEKKTPEELQLEKNYGWRRLGTHTVFEQDKDGVSVEEISSAGTSSLKDNSVAHNSETEVEVVEKVGESDSAKSGQFNDTQSGMDEIQEEISVANKELVELEVILSSVMEIVSKVEAVSEKSAVGNGHPGEINETQPEMEVDENVESFPEKLVKDAEHPVDDIQSEIPDKIEKLGEKIIIDTELHVEVVGRNQSGIEIEKRVNGEQLVISEH